MILECQNCNKKFDVNDALLSAKGRLVQCGFCHSKWFQSPEIKKINVDKVDVPINEIKPRSLKDKKKVKNFDRVESNTRSKQKNKNKNIGFFSYILIFSISIIAFFLIGETFKYQLNNIFPNFENYIIYVYETLNNMLILIKDLIKSY